MFRPGDLKKMFLFFLFVLIGFYIIFLLPIPEAFLLGLYGKITGAEVIYNIIVKKRALLVVTKFCGFLTLLVVFYSLFLSKIVSFSWKRLLFGSFVLIAYNFIRLVFLVELANYLGEFFVISLHVLSWFLAFFIILILALLKF